MVTVMLQAWQWHAICHTLCHGNNSWNPQSFQPWQCSYYVMIMRHVTGVLTAGKPAPGYKPREPTPGNQPREDQPQGLYPAPKAKNHPITQRTSSIA